jgi:hypothetical protein
MGATHSAEKVLDREFLGIRSKLIDLAASLDRIQRAPGSAADDPRVVKITQAARILALADQTPNRAEQIQLLFSLPYEEQI